MAVHIPYPDTLRQALQLSPQHFEAEIKMLALVKLYELGRISSGLAAEVLGISRVAFLEQLSRYEVSMFNAGEEAEEDWKNA